jgi:hypothetical protein
METNLLIRSLAEGAQPASRLLPPWRRTGLWLAMSLLYVGVVATLHLGGSEPRTAIDARLILEQTATLATAAAAAIAAFSSVVPGRDRRIVLLPLVPLAVWFAALGQGCLQGWQDKGAAALALRPDWDCAFPAIVLALLPAAAMVLMLRRGAPLVPRMSLALAALASAAVATLGLRMFHSGDASVQIIVWHLGGALLFSIAASRLGRRVLSWRTGAIRSGHPLHVRRNVSCL